MGLRYALSALVAFGLATPGVRAERRISVADCTFANDPEEYLSRAARARERVELWTAGLDAARSAKSARSVAAESLPRRNFIDEEILGTLQRKNVGAAPIATDEEFLRRIYLDLTGRPPTSAAIRAFVADAAENKRDAVIDKLLDSPEFIDRWSMWMGDWLKNTSTLANAAVNRNPQGRNAFHGYLRDAVTKGKPLTVIAIETISGKGNNFDAGPANFGLGASTSMGPVQDTYDTMLQRTAQIFLGMSHYDCILCHDGRNRLNPVSAWGTTQTRLSALAMAAFFSRMTFSPGEIRNSQIIADNDGGAYDLNTTGGNRPDRVPIGLVRSVTPVYRETGAIPETNNWRMAFASNMISDPMFARNIANRLWKQMFGLGLVEPVDGLDPARLDPKTTPPAPWDHQATHPELLEKLAAELTARDFNLRDFLRVLARSTSYQLSSRYGAEWNPDYTNLFARRYARRLEAEEVHDSIMQTTGVGAEYVVQGTDERARWAMQLPDTVEPASDAVARNFLNAFLRGDRDTIDRTPDGSLQQQLFLMNDNFVASRLTAGASPRLRALAALSDTEMVEEAYLTFLSRKPTAAELAAGKAAVAKAGGGEQAAEDLAWMCINKVEFLFSY